MVRIRLARGSRHGRSQDRYPAKACVEWNARDHSGGRDWLPVRKPLTDFSESTGACHPPGRQPASPIHARGCLTIPLVVGHIKSEGLLAWRHRPEAKADLPRRGNARPRNPVNHGIERLYSGLCARWSTSDGVSGRDRTGSSLSDTSASLARTWSASGLRMPIARLTLASL